MTSTCKMEKVLKIPFAELDTVRINCEQCGGAVIELPVTALMNASLICPACGKDLGKRPGVETDLRNLANGFQALQNQMEIGIQFVMSFEES